MGEARFSPGLQSGGRRAAPGRLGLVQAFVNSHHDLVEEWGADLFGTAAGLGRWLDARDFAPGPVTASELARALAVREGLRARLGEHNQLGAQPALVQAMREAAHGLGAGIEFDPDGRTVAVPVGSGVGAALGLVLAVVHEAEVAGTWWRMKACPGHECGWAFYDRSRNGSSAWCSMSICGGREKSRAYRRRLSEDAG